VPLLAGFRESAVGAPRKRVGYSTRIRPVQRRRDDFAPCRNRRFPGLAKAAESERGAACRSIVRLNGR
jgi:hypothetical protein